MTEPQTESALPDWKRRELEYELKAGLHRVDFLRRLLGIGSPPECSRCGRRFESGSPRSHTPGLRVVATDDQAG